MKLIIPLLFLLLPVLAFARLGETSAECRTRYGKPAQVNRNGSQVFKTKNCMVTVFFGKDGRVNRETYQWRHEAEDAEISRDLIEKNFGAGAYAERTTGVPSPEGVQLYNGTIRTYPVYPKDGEVELAKPETRRPVGYITVVVHDKVLSTVEYTCMTKSVYESMKPIEQRKKAADHDTSGL